MISWIMLMKLLWNQILLHLYSNFIPLVVYESKKATAKLEDLKNSGFSKECWEENSLDFCHCL